MPRVIDGDGNRNLLEGVNVANFASRPILEPFLRGGIHARHRPANGLFQLPKVPLIAPLRFFR